MIREFLMTLLLAAIFAGLSRPIYLQILSGVGGRRAPAALLTIALLLFAVFGPLATVLAVVVQQALQVAETVGPAIRDAVTDPRGIQARLAEVPGLDRLKPYMPAIADQAAQLGKTLAGFVGGWLSNLTSSVLLFVLDFVILLYAMFFFLIDGPSQLRSVLSYLPFSQSENDRLLARFLSVSRATLKGTLLIGVIQGTINGIGFWMVGLPAPAFWGAVMIVLSVVPAIGGALVWLPAAIWLAVTGRLLAAFILLIICGAISGTVDNLLRPRLVGRDTKMPDLLILVSTLGGLGLFGVAGLIVGPLVAALFLTMWEILGEVYRPSPDADADDAAL
jgi:predicted PurR-regulated permease PerM